MRDNHLKTDCSILQYTKFDYPFESEASVERLQIKNKKATPEEPQSLGKREPELALSEKEELVSKFKKVLSRKSQPAEESFNLLLKPKMVKFVGIEEVSQEASARVDEFLSDIDLGLKRTLVDKESNSDQNTIILLALKGMLQKYFNFSDKAIFRDDHFAIIMRKKIPMNIMMTVLKDYRESFISKETKSFSIKLAIPKMKELANSLIELIMNPENFDVNFFVSTTKLGKPIVMVLVYTIETWLQQARGLESILSNRSNQYNIRNLISVSSISYVSEIITSLLNLVTIFSLEHSPEGEPKIRWINVSQQLGDSMLGPNLQDRKPLFKSALSNNSLLLGSDPFAVAAKLGVTFEPSDCPFQKSLYRSDEQGFEAPSGEIPNMTANQFVSGLFNKNK